MRIRKPSILGVDSENFVYNIAVMGERREDMT